MDNKILFFFPKYFFKKAIIAFSIILFTVQVINLNNSMPLIWLIIASGTVLAFFYYLQSMSKSWSIYPDEIFRRKLFKRALLIRVIFVVFLYAFFTIMYGQPFESGAADALFYDYMGGYLSDSILDGNFHLINALGFLDIADRGYPLYLGVIYTVVFKSLLLARITNAFLGAWSCVLIYDFTKRNFNEQTARIAGIMMMLLPNLIYYCGLTLKETLMVFIVISFVNLADKLLRSKHIKIIQVLLVTALGGSLFLFRTVLAASMILSLFTSIIIISKRVSNRGRRIFIGFWICVAAVAIFYSPLGNDINTLISQKDNNQESQMKNFSTRKGGNAFAKYGTKSIFLPMILVAPFPTLVDTQQENQMMISGGVYTRNVYAFFVILALITMYRQKLLRKHALIIVSLSAYLLILASSGFALSERFHLPIVPFLVILAAFGITQVNLKNSRYFLPYLILISLIIIGWNWFKLAGRGM